MRLLSLSLCLFVATSGRAQISDVSRQPANVAGPPVSHDLRPWKQPAVSETKLPNGLTVILAEDARFPLVTERLVFLAGNKRDPKDAPGLAATVAATLARLTTKRTATQIAEDLDELGGTLSVFTSADALTVDTSVLSENAVGMLELISDISRNAVFAIDEADLRLRLRQTLVAQSQPGYVANEEFRKLVYGDVPYAHVGTTAAAIEKINRKALEEFHDRLLVPNNAFLILVGRLPARATLLKAIANEFGSWESTTVPAYSAQKPAAPKRQLVLIDRPNSTQVEIRIGKLAATYSDDGFFPEIVAAMVVAGGPDSRLVRDLKLQGGDGFDIRPDVNAVAEAGALSMVVQVRNGQAADIVRHILAELDRIAKEPVGQQELSEAKSYANGLFLSGMETQKGVADRLAQTRFMNLPMNFFEAYTARINSVEPEQVLSAAKKNLAPENCTVVVVGDASAIQQSLEAIGSFQVIHAEEAGITR